MDLKQAVETFKLDKRKRWFSFCGNVVFNEKFTNVCYNCNGSGRKECGGTGKSIDGYPVPAINPETGNPIEIIENDFVYYRPRKVNVTITPV